VHPPVREPGWWRLGAFALLLLGVALRGGAWLLDPVLPFEDGTLLFARSYAEPRLSDWLAPYAGYVPVGSNVAAWCACRLPTAVIPHAFVGLAMLLHTAAACSVLHPGWQLLGRFRLRLLLAAVVAWVPWSSVLVPTTLSYVQWTMLWWLVVVLLRPCGGTRMARLRHGLAVAMLVLWHPLALTLAPLLALPAVRRGRAAVLLGFVAALVGYWVLRQMVVTEVPAVQVERLALVPTTWLGRVMLEAFAGYELRPWLLAQLGAWSVSAAGLLLAMGWLALVLRARRRWSAPVQAFAVGVVWVGVVALAVAAMRRDQFDPDGDGSVRYFALGRLGLQTLAILALGTLASWRWAAGLGTLVLVVPWLGGVARQAVPAGGAAAMRSFVTELQAQELRRGGRRWIRARLVQDNGWVILIRPR
jgi:hypothetical protein